MIERMQPLETKTAAMIVQILIYEDQEAYLIPDDIIERGDARVLTCTSIEEFNAAVKFTAQVLSKDEEHLVE